MLETNDTTVPTVAVFTDGRTFHATGARNRLAEDTRKRDVLRGTGRIVLGITAQDVAEAEQAVAAPPPWFSEHTVRQLISQPAFMATPAAYEALRRGPIDWIIDWISSPAPHDVRTVARAVPMFLLGAARPVQASQGVQLAEIGHSVLLGEAMPAANDRQLMVWRSGALAVVVEPRGAVIDVAVVLDDRDGALDEAHGPAWRQWLRLSNLLALRDWPTTITTTTSLNACDRAQRPEPRSPAPSGLPEGAEEGWSVAYETAAPGAERDLIVALAQHSGLPAPVVGVEGPQGIPLDLSWPRLHIAVASFDMPDEDREELEASGWHVIEAKPEAILVAVTGAASSSWSDQRGEP